MYFLGQLMTERYVRTVEAFVTKVVSIEAFPMYAVATLEDGTTVGLTGSVVEWGKHYPSVGDFYVQGDGSPFFTTADALHQHYQKQVSK